MTSLTPAFDAELQKPALIMFGAVEILLPDYDLRLVDGAGVISFGGSTFVGRDETFGTLGGISDYVDGVDDEAPTLTLTLNTPTNAAMAAIAAPGAQGSQVSIWVGALDPVTGLVIEDPDLCFLGQTDVPTQRVGERSRSLELSIVSIFDLLFDQDEGVCLNVGFDNLLHPGQLGLEFVSVVREPPVWGSDAPKAGLKTGIFGPGGIAPGSLPLGMQFN